MNCCHISVGYLEPDWRNKQDHDISDTTAEGNIENMLAVEKGLRELSSLKVLLQFLCSAPAFDTPFSGLSLRIRN